MGVQGVHDGGGGPVPIEIDVSSGTPALFRTLPPPGLVEAQLGDLTISVYVAPAGRPRELVLRATCARPSAEDAIPTAQRMYVALQDRGDVRLAISLGVDLDA
jgi:hypothetical protein